MTPGPDLIVACPSCSKLVRIASLGSGNTFGAVFWTDGKMDAPMLPDLPPIGGCPGCGVAFWFRDAKQVGKIDPYARYTAENEVPAEWSEAPEPKPLDEEQLLDAIDDGMVETSEKEECLRLMAWHAFNDQFRRDGHHDDQPRPSERQEANVKQIEKLFMYSDDWDDLFISADAARQLGNFEKAKNILNNIDVEEILQKKRFLMELCAQESRLVRRIPFDETDDHAG